MKIYYRDEGGGVCVDVDEYGIQFLDGFAYFSNGEREFRIPISDLLSIE